MGTEQQQSHEETLQILRSWYTVGSRIERYLIGVRMGTIVGFGKKYIPRGGFDHKRAGVYMDLFNLRIEGADGSEWMESLGEPLDKRELEGVHRDIALLDIRLGDLPDTPFWVGDVVRVSNSCFSGQLNGVSDRVRRVEQVVYNPTSSLAERYNISGVGIKHLVRAGDLDLVERGNIWKLEHGEPLSFPGETEEARLLEEAAFYKSLGMSQKFQRHKETGIIGWSNESGQENQWPIGTGIKMLQAGTADRVVPTDKKNQLVAIIKYDNAEFGARMRVAELKRLGF